MKKYLLALPVLMLLALSGCSSDDVVENDPPSPEPPPAVEEKTENFELSEDNAVVETSEYTIALPPSVFGDEKLTLEVAQKSPSTPIVEGGDNCTVYDIKLGDIHDLPGVAEIRIPRPATRAASGKRLGVAYYNEEKKEWYPVDWHMSGDTVVITTDHFSEFALFDIIKENTSKQKYVDYFFGYPEVALNQTKEVIDILYKLSQTDCKESELIDVVSNVYGKASQFGIDILYNVIQGMGYENSFLSSYGNHLGYIGLLFSLWDIARKQHAGDTVGLGGASLKTIGSYYVGLAASAIGTSLMFVSMGAIAIFDYALNMYMEDISNWRKDGYREMYRLYYDRNRRTTQQWYNVLSPVFRQKGKTEQEVNAEVDKIVTDYCKSFWDDDATVGLYYEEVFHRVDDGWGGLSNELMANITTEHKSELYSYMIPNVMKLISSKLEEQLYDDYAEAMVQYGKMMNQTLTFDIYDANARDGKSALEGCTVRFANTPSTVVDPENWECTLDESGKGKITLTILAHTSNNIQPKMQVIDKDGKVIQELEYTVKVPRTTIPINVNPIEEKDEEGALRAVLRDLYECRDGEWANCNWGDPTVPISRMSRVSEWGDGSALYEITIPQSWKLSDRLVVNDHTQEGLKVINKLYRLELQGRSDRNFKEMSLLDGGLGTLLCDGDITVGQLNLKYRLPHFSCFVSCENFSMDGVDQPEDDLNFDARKTYSGLLYPTKSVSLSNTNLNRVTFVGGNYQSATERPKVVPVEFKNTTLRYSYEISHSTLDNSAISQVPACRVNVTDCEVQGTLDFSKTQAKEVVASCACDSVIVKDAPNLEKLTCSNFVDKEKSAQRFTVVGCPKLTFANVVSEVATQLRITSCPELTYMNLTRQPKLNKLILDENYPALETFYISSCHSLTSKMLPFMDRLLNEGKDVSYDVRYTYRRDSNGEIKVTDKGYGFYYEDEPGRGYHRK